MEGGTEGHHEYPPVSAAFEITVGGEIDKRWSAWFGGVVVARVDSGSGSPTTVLRVSVADQAALRGIVERIWDLNLVLISIRRLEGHPRDSPDSSPRGPSDPGGEV